jgi:molybdopterin converting factor small subunit
LKVEVLFLGKAREIAETEREVVTLKKGARLADLVAKLGAEHGHALSDFLLKPPQGVQIMVNGTDSSRIGGLDAPLSDKDTVAWLPVIFGG